MRDIIKLLLIPIAGCVGIAIIFMFVVWAGNFQPAIVNEDGRYVSASKDVGGYAVLRAGAHCDNSYYPVCGMDGKSYDNACKAMLGGTKVAHRGVCES